MPFGHYYCSGSLIYLAHIQEPYSPQSHRSVYVYMHLPELDSVLGTSSTKQTTKHARASNKDTNIYVRQQAPGKPPKVIVLVAECQNQPVYTIEPQNQSKCSSTFSILCISHSITLFCPPPPPTHPLFPLPSTPWVLLSHTVCD